MDNFDAIRLDISLCNEWSPPDKPRTNDIERDFICKLSKVIKFSKIDILTDSNSGIININERFSFSLS